MEGLKGRKGYAPEPSGTDTTEGNPMWHTSCGDRTLHGAEARLFAEALWSLLDEAHTDQPYDYDLGLACFDDLTYGQKVSVLAAVGNGLLREDVPVAPLTAVLEGGIAAVFQHLRDSVAFEIDEPEVGTRWRSLIATALREMEADEVPAPACEDEDEWDIGMQELSDTILWDADYEDGDLYLDRPPPEARNLMDEMWIADGYFDAIADDLSEEQAEAKIAELRALCTAVVGP